MCAATSSNEAILTAIRHTVPTLLPNCSEVSDIQPVSQSRHHSVWKVGTRDGTLLAVKHQPFAPLTKNKPYDLLEVEQQTCKLLGASQAPIPHLIGINYDHDLIFSQWCGDLTLDDMCQTSNTGQVGKTTINGFLAFEAAFQQHTPDLAPRAFPGCDPDSLLQTWSEIIGSISDRLTDLIAYLNPPSPPEPSPLQELFLELCQMLSNIPPTLGPTDYNARNIVMDPQHDRVFFLECAKLGWDWSERRLVQYTTGMGAGHRQGSFKSLLTPKTAKQYAVHAAAYRTQPPDQILHWLDGHHIVFHILAASRLLDASTNTNHPLRLAWQNLDARRKQLRVILARPLSDHLQHARLRSFF